MRKKGKSKDSKGPSATSGGDSTSNSFNYVNRPFISPLLPATPSSGTSSSDSFGLFGSDSLPPGFGSFGFGSIDSETLAHTRPFSSIRSSDTSSGTFGLSKASFGSRPFIAPQLSDSDASDSDASEKAPFGTRSSSFGLGKASFGSRPFTAPPFSDSDSEASDSEKASGISGSRPFTAPPFSDFDSEASDSEKASSIGREFDESGTSDISDSETFGESPRKRTYPIVKGTLAVTEEDAEKLDERDLDWLENSHTRAVTNYAKGEYGKRFVSIYRKVKGEDPPKLIALGDLPREREYPIVKGSLAVTEEDAKKLSEDDLNWLENSDTRAVTNYAKGVYTKRFVSIYKKVKGEDPPPPVKASFSIRPFTVPLLSDSDTPSSEASDFGTFGTSGSGKFGTFGDLDDNLTPKFKLSRPDSLASPSKPSTHSDSGDRRSFDDYLNQIVKEAIDDTLGDVRTKAVHKLAQIISGQHRKIVMLQARENAHQKTVLLKSRKRKHVEDDGTSGDDEENASDGDDENDTFGDDEEMSMKYPEATPYLINCHAVYIIACAKTGKLLYIGKSNNGIYGQPREKRHCTTSLKKEEDRTASDEWHHAYPAIAKALRRDGIFMFRPFVDLPEDLAYFKEAALITANDGLSQMPGSLRMRFVGQDEQLKREGKKLLRQVKQILSDQKLGHQELIAYNANTYRDYSIEWKLRECKGCKNQKPVFGNGICQPCKSKLTNTCATKKAVYTKNSINRKYAKRDTLVDYCTLSSKERNKCPGCGSDYSDNLLRIKFKIVNVMGGFFWHPNCLAKRKEFTKSWEQLMGFEELQESDQESLKLLFPAIEEDTEE